MSLGYFVGVSGVQALAVGHDLLDVAGEREVGEERLRSCGGERRRWRWARPPAARLRAHDLGGFPSSCLGRRCTRRVDGMMRSPEATHARRVLADCVSITRFWRAVEVVPAVQGTRARRGSRSRRCGRDVPDLALPLRVEQILQVLGASLEAPTVLYMITFTVARGRSEAVPSLAVGELVGAAGPVLVSSFLSLAP